MEARRRPPLSGPDGGAEGHDGDRRRRRQRPQGRSRSRGASRNLLRPFEERADHARDQPVVMRTSGDPAAFVAELAIDRPRRRADRGARGGWHARVARVGVGCAAAVCDGACSPCSRRSRSTLAATGLYGVLSYSVSQRRREIGIRSALGATRANVIALVLRQGLTVDGRGPRRGRRRGRHSGRGLLQPLLFGIRPLDLPSFALMPLMLLVVAIVACLVPARRAAATDPAITLRERVSRGHSPTSPERNGTVPGTRGVDGESMRSFLHELPKLRRGDGAHRIARILFCRYCGSFHFPDTEGRRGRPDCRRNSGSSGLRRVPSAADLGDARRNAFRSILPELPRRA